MKPPTNEEILYRELEHTGDLRIEVSAPARSELFRRAALALAALLVDPSNVAAIQPRTIEISASDDIALMHDLLTELLQLYAADGFIWRDANVEERRGGLHVILKGESFDPARHLPRDEIKAVTYHQMSVENAANEWRARMIFDV
jgi:SHS2 domain-containing protein